MNYDKILGCLLGAAAGDAMGAATETRNREQIEEYFGGYVKKFFTPPEDTFAHGCEKGQITDDFSIAYLNCCEIVKNGGVATEDVAKKALLKWYDAPQFSRFAGPTTKAAIHTMMGQQKKETTFTPAVDNGKGTNGAAMKASPLALFSGGNVDQAIEDTLIMCRVTHNNNVALSGACAVAAATAAALKKESKLEDIIKAGVYGAVKGDEAGRRDGKEICGPSIAKRIQKAVEIGMTSRGMKEAICGIEDYIGSGLMAAEAVPAVFGIIAASGGSALEGIFGAVNIGDDTDTVATMVGGILGAWEGAKAFPEEYLTIIHEHNPIDLKKLAGQIWELAEREGKNV